MKVFPTIPHIIYYMLNVGSFFFFVKNIFMYVRVCHEFVRQGNLIFDIHTVDIWLC